MTAQIIPFNMQARAAASPNSGSGGNEKEELATKRIERMQVKIHETALPTNKDVPIEKLYPLLNEETTLLSVALRLLEESEKKLQEAKQLFGEDDAMEADDHVQHFQALLPELFCCRQLGESFATLINTFFHAVKNQQGKPFNGQQIAALLHGVSNLKFAPFMGYDDAVDIVIELEKSGLTVDPAGMQPIAEVLIG